MQMTGPHPTQPARGPREGDTHMIETTRRRSRRLPGAVVFFAYLMMVGCSLSDTQIPSLMVCSGVSFR